MLLITVVYLMSSFHDTIEPLSLEMSMNDVLKTLNSAVLKINLQVEYYNADESFIHLKLPKKVSGYKYRIVFNETSNQFCFVFPEEYCRDTYLLRNSVPINADIDSSKDEHYAYYSNGEIWVF